MQHDMTTHPKGESTLAIAKLGKLAALTAMASALVGAPVWAQNYPITAAQKETARAVAQQGVPLSELAANAPERYTVKSGDTLWAISRLYLKSPWRWPELWGMNLQQIRNPHLIYPGQILYLDKTGGRARLRVGQAIGPDGSVKLSPRVRSSGLGDGAIPSIPFHLIEPFLTEAVIFPANELETAPRRAYTGSVGYLNHDGTLDSNILIRTFMLEGDSLRFRAGAGIVADSDPSRELQETRHKARGLLRALGIDTP